MDYQVKSKMAWCQSEFLKIHQGKDFAKFLSIHEDHAALRAPYQAFTQHTLG